MTEPEKPTVSVFWRLPERLVEDCEGLDGNNWADGFRTLLQKAMSSGITIVPEGGAVSKSMSLPSDVDQWLLAEAERLSAETGQSWSAMQVAREIWRQQRLHKMTRAATREAAGG